MPRTAFWFLFATLVPLSCWADRLVLQDGERLEGPVIYQRNGLIVCLPSGPREIRTEEILSHTPTSASLPDNCADLLRLGRNRRSRKRFFDAWAIFRTLRDRETAAAITHLAREELARTVLVERQALGLTQDGDGRWLTFWEAKKAEGFVRHLGLWVRPEQIEALESAKKERNEPFATLSTSRFTIRLHIPDPEGLFLDRLANWTERLCKSYEKAFPESTRKEEKHPPIHIAVYPDEKSYLERGGIEGSRGTAALHGGPLESLKVYLGDLRTAAPLLQTYAHELCHVYIHRAWPKGRLPLWLDEALAEHHAHAALAGAAPLPENFRDDDEIKLLLLRIRDAAPPLLPSLFNDPRGFDYLQYGAAWSVITFLMDRRPTLWENLLRRLRSGAEIKTLLSRLAAEELAWRNDVRRQAERIWIRTVDRMGLNLRISENGLRGLALLYEGWKKGGRRTAYRIQNLILFSDRADAGARKGLKDALGSEDTRGYDFGGEWEEKQIVASHDAAIRLALLYGERGNLLEAERLLRRLQRVTETLSLSEATTWLKEQIESLRTE